MTTQKFYQLVDIPDFRYDSDCSSINYGYIADDCDTKTVSILDAINHISLSIFSMTEDENINKDQLNKLSCVISDLTELAIATNKISQTASYLAGVKEANNGK